MRFQGGRVRRQKLHRVHVRVHEGELDFCFDVGLPVLDKLKLEGKGEPVEAPAVQVNALADGLGQVLVRHQAGRDAAELDACLAQEPAVAAEHGLLGIQPKEAVFVVKIVGQRGTSAATRAMLPHYPAVGEQNGVPWLPCQ